MPWISPERHAEFLAELQEDFPPEHLPAGACREGAWELPWPAMWVKGEHGMLVADLPPAEAEWGEEPFTLKWQMVCSERRVMGTLSGLEE